MVSVEIAGRVERPHEILISFKIHGKLKIMDTAKELREISEKANNEIPVELVVDMRNEASLGSRSTFWFKGLTEKQVDVLNDLGYKAKIKSDATFKRRFYEISW
jgi:hypothetical protein